MACDCVARSRLSQSCVIRSCERLTLWTLFLVSEIPRILFWRNHGVLVAKEPGKSTLSDHRFPRQLQRWLLQCQQGIRKSTPSVQKTDGDDFLCQNYTIWPITPVFFKKSSTKSSIQWERSNSCHPLFSRSWLTIWLLFRAAVMSLDISFRSLW